MIRAFRRSERVLAILAPFSFALVAGAGCPLPPVYECTGDLSCGVGGQCEDTGYCSFEDADCASGRRYGEFVGGGLADLCVMGELAEESGDGDGDESAGDGDGEPGDGDGDLEQEPVSLRLINFSPGEPVYLFDEVGELVLGPVDTNEAGEYVELEPPWDALSLFYLGTDLQVEVGPDTPSIVAPLAAPRTTLAFVGGDALSPGEVLSLTDPMPPVEPGMDETAVRLVHAGLILGEIDVYVDDELWAENLAKLANLAAPAPVGDISVGIDGNEDGMADAEASVTLPSSEDLLEFFVLSDLGQAVSYALVAGAGPCLIVPASAP